MKKLRGRHALADHQGAEHVREIAVVAEINAPLAENIGESILRLILCETDVGDFRHGRKFPAELPAGLRGRVIAETFDDFIVFKNA